jgi:hypothetical protein
MSAYMFRPRQAVGLRDALQRLVLEGRVEAGESQTWRIR